MKKSRKNDVIKSANCIIRKVGYSNLSFIQISKELNITRENVHHYFKKKELLGNTCLSLMAKDLTTQFENIIKSELTSSEKIEAYFKIYKIQGNEKEDCPIVSLLAEYEILPDSMKKQVQQLIQIEQKNMEIILEEGVNNKSFFINNSIKEESCLIISLLKGAVSYSKIFNNFKITTKLLLKSLKNK
jgi:TetR/AcrR family transcriptional repressor of nem operon